MSEHPLAAELREGLRQMEQGIRSNPKLAALIKRARKCPTCDSLNFATDHVNEMYQCHNCIHRWPMDNAS